MKPLRPLTFVLALSFAIPASYAQHDLLTLEQATDRANYLVDSICTRYNVAGLDAALSLHGKLVWSKTFGYAHLEEEIPVKAGVSQFRIASISKSLTAIGLALLYEAGKIDLDEDVHTYVPFFPEKKYSFSVRQLAGHVAGIRAYNLLKYKSELLSNVHYTTVTSSLKIFSDDKLKFRPGTNYKYTTYGYTLLSSVIEGGSGERFLSYMRRNLFEKLGMYATCPDRKDSTMVNRTAFYKFKSGNRLVPEAEVDLSNKWGGGGFLSTTTDLIKFGNAILENKLISAETRKLFTTPTELPNGEKTTYGLGFGLYDGGFGHTGSGVGARSRFKIFPESAIVFVLLTNVSQPFGLNKKEPDYTALQDEIGALFSRVKLN